MRLKQYSNTDVPCTTIYNPPLLVTTFFSERRAFLLLRTNDPQLRVVPSFGGEGCLQRLPPRCAPTPHDQPRAADRCRTRLRWTATSGLSPETTGRDSWRPANCRECPHSRREVTLAGRLRHSWRPISLDTPGSPARSAPARAGARGERSRSCSPDSAPRSEPEGEGGRQSLRRWTCKYHRGSIQVGTVSPDGFLQNKSYLPDLRSQGGEDHFLRRSRGV